MFWVIIDIFVHPKILTLHIRSKIYMLFGSEVRMFTHKRNIIQRGIRARAGGAKSAMTVPELLTPFGKKPNVHARLRLEKQRETKIRVTSTLIPV